MKIDSWTYINLLNPSLEEFSSIGDGVDRGEWVKRSDFSSFLIETPRAPSEV